MLRNIVKSVVLRIPPIRRLHSERDALQMECVALKTERTALMERSAATDARLAALRQANDDLRQAHVDLQRALEEQRATLDQRRNAIRRLSAYEATITTSSPPADSFAPACPSCESRSSNRVGRRSDFNEWFLPLKSFVDDIRQFDRDVFACQTCGVHFIDPLYSLEDLTALYLGSGYQRFRAAYRVPPERMEQHRQHLVENFTKLGLASYADEFGREQARNPRHLDIGCGEGDTLRALRTLGFDVCGIDMDAHVVTDLRAAGFDVEKRRLEDLDGEGEFDVISAMHLIEHLNDPNQLFLRVKRLLRKNGLLVIETPYLDDAGATPERYSNIYHTLFFDHFSLGHIAAKHGFHPRSTAHVAWAENEASHHNNMIVSFGVGDGARTRVDDLAVLRPLFERLEEDARVWSRGFVFCRDHL